LSGAFAGRSLGAEEDAMSAIDVALMLAVVAAVGLLVAAVVSGWSAVRGAHIVECPETHAPVTVHLDARKALKGSLRGAPLLEVSDCSRWPERAGCGQECLAQMESAPADCLVRNVASRWYEGRGCVYCGHVFEPIRWHEHRPALRGPDGALLEWSDVEPHELPALFATHVPVCWNCAIAERFRRDHPDLVVDRPKPPLPGRDEHREPYH
jgi:hypothetical protein